MLDFARCIRPVKGTTRQHVDLRDARAVAQEVVEEEVVKFVGSDDGFRFLAYLAVLRRD